MEVKFKKTWILTDNKPYMKVSSLHLWSLNGLKVSIVQVILSDSLPIRESS